MCDIEVAIVLIVLNSLLLVAGFIVDDAHVYGLRLQPCIQNKTPRKFHKKLFRPHLFND